MVLLQVQAVCSFTTSSLPRCYPASPLGGSRRDAAWCESHRLGLGKSLGHPRTPLSLRSPGALVMNA
jgi:hypothetical protein